jgi:hypothetical protein
MLKFLNTGVAAVGLAFAIFCVVNFDHDYFPAAQADEVDTYLQTPQGRQDMQGLKQKLNDRINSGNVPGSYADRLEKQERQMATQTQEWTKACVVRAMTGYARIGYRGADLANEAPANCSWDSRFMTLDDYLEARQAGIDAFFRQYPTLR